jgi:hypothetical protein
LETAQQETLWLSGQTNRERGKGGDEIRLQLTANNWNTKASFQQKAFASQRRRERENRWWEANTWILLLQRSYHQWERRA